MVVQSQPVAPARVHAAIVHRRFAAMILDGRKTVEARLSASRREPFGVVAVGEAVWFRVIGGAFFARAVVSRVESHADLTPARVAELRRRLDGQVLGGPAFWAAKQAAKYATFIWLAEVEPAERAPRLRFLPRAGWASGPAGD